MSNQLRFILNSTYDSNKFPIEPNIVFHQNFQMYAEPAQTFGRIQSEISGMEKAEHKQLCQLIARHQLLISLPHSSCLPPNPISNE